MEDESDPLAIDEGTHFIVNDSSLCRSILKSKCQTFGVTNNINFIIDKLFLEGRALIWWFFFFER